MAMAWAMFSRGHWVLAMIVQQDLALQLEILKKTFGITLRN
jgi:hypothetical protein